MVKELYKILEISETAAQEEIKKAYHKLAFKWHPDKWSNKNSAEKEKTNEEMQKANEEMQKVNKAYEVLGDEEKRKTYDGLEKADVDLGDDWNKWEEIINNSKIEEEELKKKIKKGIKDTRQQMLKSKMELDRFSVINEISEVFNFTYPQIFKEDLSKSLWEPYQDWREKVAKMEISIPEGSELSEELRVFKEEMVEAIDEARNKKQAKQQEEEQEKGQPASWVEKAKKRAIESIEEEMKEKDLKARNLGKYSNYKEQINDLNEVEKITDLREKIIESMNENDSAFTYYNVNRGW